MGQTNAECQQGKLQEVAKEMNTVMCLQPIIDIDLGLHDLFIEIEKASVEIEPDDIFSKEVNDILDEMGLLPCVVVDDDGTFTEKEDDVIITFLLDVLKVSSRENAKEIVKLLKAEGIKPRIENNKLIL